MIIISGWLEIICLILFMSVAFKTIIGIHWPWEKCQCCGKRWSEIRKERKRKTLLKNSCEFK